MSQTVRRIWHRCPFGPTICSKRVEAICASLNVEIAYAFQDLSSIPAGYAVPNGRTKPWGTGQAVLAAKDLIHEPFAVINAD